MDLNVSNILSDAHQGVLSDSQLSHLAQDIDALYAQTQARMGQADLDYIAHVKDYACAIKARSDWLFAQPISEAGVRSFTDAVTLCALYNLLEFSIGHTILHGSYDHLYSEADVAAGRAPFHSSIYKWDFAVDVAAWKTMHHQNHHPFTNIKGLDHDLGYGIFRMNASQNWWGHNLVQLPLIALILASHSAYFSLYTAYSAGAIAGKKWYQPTTYKGAVDVIKNQWIESYITKPMMAARARLSHGERLKAPLTLAKTAVGNLLGNILGYDYLVGLLIMEHHAHNVTIFEPQNRGETKGEYYHRQIMATANFIPNTRLDDYLKRVLAQVEFVDAPDFRVFYEALDTHLEHHLFPDLPGNRLREITPQVERIFERYGLPFNQIDLGEAVGDIAQRLFSRGVPIANKSENLLDLVRMPRKLAARLYYGLTYKKPPMPFYMGELREDLTNVKVIASRSIIGGQARLLELELPSQWQHMTWEAGAFISVQVRVGGKQYIRQYSITCAKTDRLERVRSLHIVVKRVTGGVVSNHINNNIKAGSSLALFRKPQSEDGFAMPLKAEPSHPQQSNTNNQLSNKLLFIAGGVGITPIMSMMRFVAQHYPNTDMQLLYFNRDARSIIFKREIDTLAQSSKLQVKHFVSHLNNDINNGTIHATSNTGLSQGRFSKTLITSLADDINLTDCDIYMCAPAQMIVDCKNYLTELNVDMARFHEEQFVPTQTTLDPKADKRFHTITFAKSDKTVVINENTTLLEAAKQAGVSVLTGCEKGLCKACVCPKTSGQTSLDAQSGKLEKITICNARPLADVVLAV